MENRFFSNFESPKQKAFPKISFDKFDILSSNEKKKTSPWVLEFDDNDDYRKNSPKTLLRKRSLLFRQKSIKLQNKKKTTKSKMDDSTAFKERISNENSKNVQEFNLESPKSSHKQSKMREGFETPDKKRAQDIFETPKKKKSLIFRDEIEMIETPKHENDFLSYSTYKSPNPNNYTQASGKLCLSGGESVFENSFSRFDEDYEVLKVLGSGNFGCVYKCMKHIDGEIYAVKAIKQKMRGGIAKSALNEVKSLSAFTNSVEDKNIVRYYSAWIENKQLYIVMEYCSQSLREYQSEHPVIRESSIRKIARDIGIALKHLHDNKLVHLDIKPENILLSTNGNFKLGDFGLARIAYISAYEDIDEGDSRYLAPEIMNPFNQDISKSDIFSLGITLFELMTGEQLPVNGIRWHDLRKRTISLNELTPITNYSENLKSIVSQMMSESSERRPSSASLLSNDIFQSDIILELKWQKILYNLRKSYKEELEQIKSPQRKMTF